MGSYFLPPFVRLHKEDSLGTFSQRNALTERDHLRIVDVARLEFNRPSLIGLVFGHRDSPFSSPLRSNILFVLLRLASTAAFILVGLAKDCASG